MVMMVKKKTKNIGLDAEAPKGTCKSVKCPWHGSLKIRGRIFSGIVKSSKAAESAVVEWNYYQYLHKYERYERRKTNLMAHNPKCIDAKVGDMVELGECRPLSKGKRFVIFRIVKKGEKA
jgi:small subunit ribosomal protein S17